VRLVVFFPFELETVLVCFPLATIRDDEVGFFVDWLRPCGFFAGAGALAAFGRVPVVLLHKKAAA
jgi:hypothetical protein